MNVLDLFARILLNTDDYDRNLDGAAERANAFGETLKKGLATAAKVGTAAITAASSAIGVLTKQSIDGYAEYEQLVGGVETLFKNSADAVMKYADNAYKTAGMSANEYMETVTSFSASLLQSLGGDTEKAASVADQAITDMSDNANKMGTSMEMIQNAYQGFAKQNYTMLDNLKLGYGGTKEEMQRLLEDAEKLSGIEYDISSFADITEAIHIVQTEMGITGTTAAEAASTIEGSMASAKAAWSNLVTGIADENANLENLINLFVESVGTAAGNIIPRVQQILIGMGDALQTLAPLISEQVPAVIAGVLPSLVSAGSQLIVALVTGLIGALPELASAVPEIVEVISSALSESLPNILSAGEELRDVALNMISNMGTYLSENLPTLIESGISLLMEFGAALASNVGILADAGLSLVRTIVNGISESIPTILPELIESGLSLLNDFSESLRENAGMLVDAALELAKNIAKGLADSIPTIIEQVPTIVSNIAGVINDNAPKILAAGVEIIGTLIKGILSAIPTLIANAPKIVSAVVDVITAFNWLNLGKSILDGLLNGIKSLLGNVGTTARTIVQNFRTVISDLPGYMRAIGSDIISGLINGIKASFGRLKNSAIELGETVLGTIKNKLGINSPSKVFREEVGQYISLGVAEGIADKSDDAVKAADKLAKDVYSRSKDWADKNTKYMALSLEEQAELWETIQSQFIKGSKQYSDAEEKIFDLRAKAQEEYQKEAEASQKKYLDSATKVLEAFKKKGQEILKENEDLQKQYQDTLAKRTSEIFKSFGLFDEIPEREEKSGTKLIENLRGQIDSIQSFYDSLTELEERGAASALVDEIRGMGVGAADELAALLSLTDDQLSEYSNLYGEKQELANSIALEELEGLRVETENKIHENLDSLKNLYIELAPGVGTAFADGLAQGILNGLVTVADAAEQVAKAAIEASMKALDEHSPSKLAEKIGLNFDKGLSNGLLSGEDMISRDVNRILDFGTANVDFASSGLGMSSAAIVNSAAGGGLGASGPISLNIPVMLPDGTVLARAMISDLIKVASAAGTPIVSTGYA